MAHNPLLSANAVSLSLSAPRVPSDGTVQRDLLVGRTTPSGLEDRLRKFDGLDHEDSARLELLYKSLVKAVRTNTFPHLRKSPPDALIRWLAIHAVPLSFQHRCRDGGGSRIFIDLLTILFTAPPLAAIYPTKFYQFLQLGVGSSMTSIRVGPHWRQHVELFLPSQERSSRRLIFFLHGGAWGSGFAWMYRLVVVPFLEMGWAVALPNYRTYPDGMVQDQIHDVELAASELQKKHGPFEKVLLMGHSSAAHTALLMLVQRLVAPAAAPTLHFDAFLGLSGPYKIADHFAFEASRGLEEFSPMKPVCGSSPAAFRHSSPCLRLLDESGKSNQQNPSWRVPPITLMHGMDDSTVPFTATCDAARLLRSLGVGSVEEVYLPGVGHQDVPIQMMLGGVCQEFVVDWVRRQANDDGGSSASNVRKQTKFFVHSKL